MEVKEAHAALAGLLLQAGLETPMSLGNAAAWGRVWGAAAGALPRLRNSPPDLTPRAFSTSRTQLPRLSLEEGRRGESMLARDFSNTSKFWLQFLFPFP